MGDATIHLLDVPSAGRACLLAYRAVVTASTPGTTHIPLLLGSSDDERSAFDAGIRTVDRVLPPTGGRIFSAGPLRSWASARSVSPSGVVAWSARTHALARRVFSGVPVVEASDESRWPIDADLLELDRAGCKRALGIDPETLVLGAPVCPWSSLATRVSAWWLSYAAGVMRFTGTRWAVVIPERARAVDRALRFTELHGEPGVGGWPAVVESRPLCAFAGAIDVFLDPALFAVRFHKPMPSVHSGLRWALASGRPIVAAQPTAEALDAPVTTVLPVGSPARSVITAVSEAARTPDLEPRTLPSELLERLAVAPV
ncbi:MAG: hypothetical protein AAGD00_08890 [Planctomycetota bacterium]